MHALKLYLSDPTDIMPLILFVLFYGVRICRLVLNKDALCYILRSSVITI